MKESKILERDNPILRKVAKAVPPKDIGSKKIGEIIKRMKEALHEEEDGVAIAAPQIGESLRIFVVKKEPQDLVFINPEIIKFSKKRNKVEEGCLSIRWLYGKVKRSEKVTIKARDENGKGFQRGASGLMAQIFQHEVDHLNGVLFIDKAEDVQDIPPPPQVKFVFFGSSQFSQYVLEELKIAGLHPALNITSAKEPLPMDKLRELDADVFIVASFGKILPKELIDMPKFKTLNVHPSLLPRLRGASPIQNTILTDERPGVTIIKMDEKMDHGPILAQAKISITPWPDKYQVVEEKLGRAGARLLGLLLPNWINGGIKELPQEDSLATYTKLIKKEDGLLDLNDSPEANLRKVLAYNVWPSAYMMFKKKGGKEVRVVVKEAKVEAGQFIPTRVIPEGKREMVWQDFLRGN